MDWKSTWTPGKGELASTHRTIVVLDLGCHTPQLQLCTGSAGGFWRALGGRCSLTPLDAKRDRSDFQ